MGRPPKGTAPGRSSDFTGEKKEFLESFYDRLLEAGFGSGGNPGPIYTDVTDKWLQQYGYDLPLSQNVDGDPVDNPPVDQLRSTDEKQTIRKALRTKISGWYRTRYRGKKVHSGTIKEILTTMQSMSGQTARPRRKPATALYSKLHYATRVKPEFDKVWASVKTTVPRTMRAAMSQDFVGTCWEKESDAFRQQIEDQAKEEHPETYHDALENLNDVGIPLVDALTEHLGMHVVLMAVGPVSDADGEVLLRSVFSDTAAGATSRTWPQFDHPGFTAMEKSITCYGRAFFTKAECQERVWPAAAATKDTPVTNLDGLLPIDSGANSGASGASTTISDNPIPETARTPTPETTAAPSTSLCATVPPIVVMAPPVAPSDETIPPDGIDQHRVWDDYKISEEFGEQLLDWWRCIGPLKRWEDVPQGEAPVRNTDWPDWGRINASGANGPILFVVGLAWWGQKIWNAGAATGLGGGEAALAAAGDWHLLAEDLKWALEDPLLRDRIGEEKTAAEKEQQGGEGEKEDAEKAGKAGKGKKRTVKEPAKKRKRASDQEGSESKRKRSKGQSTGAEEPPARPKSKPLTRSTGQAQDVAPTLTPAPPASTPSLAPPANDTAADDGANTHSGAQGAEAAEGILPAGDTPSILEAASGALHTVPTVTSGTPPRPSQSHDKMPSQESQDTTGMDVDKEPDFDLLAGLTEEEQAEMLADPEANE
ncbi:hypothetical protein K438DRAFT_1971149 [Mycena galopus ATCC 62051]|nr:hypothetical protein K438DRAFT_1971149 [Mycena galopus ATCC 62051]